jgi:carbon-monoxide dehydrogenase medium subunit
MSLFGYVAPQSLDEVIAVLGSHSEARVLGGGHTLLLPASRNKLGGSLLVDLRKIKTIAGVERLSDGTLKIGATTTIAELAASNVVREQVPELCEAALLVGDAQLRNRATVAGNIAAFEAGADLPALLLVLNARLEITGHNGSREMLLVEFLRGPLPVALGSDELIVSIAIPALAKRSGLAYEKFKHPATLFALCGVAAAVQLTAEGDVSEVKVAVTGSTGRVQRLFATEAALVGKAGNDTSVRAAARVPDSTPNFVSDLFASAEYRTHLTHVLAERALKRAIAAATTA